MTDALCLQRYEGGFAQQPGLEANGSSRLTRWLRLTNNDELHLLAAGPTYCAIASFKLASRLHDLPEPPSLLRWLLDRQVRPPPLESSDSSDEDEEAEPGGPARDPDDAAGFQGRANKPTDACYSFWNMGALSVRPFSSPSTLRRSLTTLSYSSSYQPSRQIYRSTTSSTQHSTEHGFSTASTRSSAASLENRAHDQVGSPLFILRRVDSRSKSGQTSTTRTSRSPLLRWATQTARSWACGGSMRAGMSLLRLRSGCEVDCGRSDEGRLVQGSSRTALPARPARSPVKQPQMRQS